MRVKQARNLAALLATILLLGSGFNNCGQRTQTSLREARLLASSAIRGGTSGGNPARTTLKFGPFENADGREKRQSMISVQDFSICLTAIEFTPVTGDAFLVQYDRVVSLLPDGTAIGDVTIPEGSYNEIEILIDNTCGTDLSFSVTNAAGTFTGTSGTKMIFEGDFVSDTSGHSVTLDIAAIVSALSSASSDDDALSSLGTGGSLDTTTAAADPLPSGR